MRLPNVIPMAFTCLCCCVAVALVIPYTTAGLNVFLIASVVLAVGCLNWKASWTCLREKSFVMLLLAFVAWMLLSLLWTQGTLKEYFTEVVKYRKLIFFLFLFLIFQSKSQWKECILFAYFLSGSILVLLCVASWLGIPGVRPITGAEVDTEKGHIALGILLTLLALIDLDYMFNVAKRTLKVAAGFSFALCLFVVFYLSLGRTGYVCVSVGILYWLIIRLKLGFRKIVGLLIVGSCALCLIYAASPRMQNGVRAVYSDVTQVIQKGNYLTSNGTRIKMWRASLRAMRDRPIIGVGWGAWKKNVCERYSVDRANIGSLCGHGHPHQDFLNVGSQLGIVGLLLWLGFLLSLVRYGARLESRDRNLLFSFVAAYLVGCLYNSFTHDVTEGNLFIFFTALLLAQVRTEGQPNLLRV